MYGNGNQVREWIWVEDNVNEIWRLMKEGIEGVKHIGSRNRWKNIDIILLIGKILNKKVKYEQVSDRLGHDKRYALHSLNKINLTLDNYLEGYILQNIEIQK